MATLAQLDRARRGPGVSLETLGALARAVTAAAASESVRDALRHLAEPARALAGADVALLRVLDASGERLEVVAVAGPSTLAAELEGSQLPLAELPAETLADLERASEAVRRAAARAGATSLLLVPVRVGSAAGALELLRADGAFTVDERAAGELAAAEIALVLGAFAGRPPRTAATLARPALELAGEALAAALDDSRAAADIARVAAVVSGARAGVVWECAEDGLLLGGTHGLAADADLGPARELAEQALSEPGAVRSRPAERLPGGRGIATTVPLGRPAAGVLQLLHPAGDGPDHDQLARLATFGVRAANALRASERSRRLSLELERTRALVAVIGQATAELSVAHTLDTAIDRIADLLAVERVAVYLRGGGGLEPAAERGLVGPHTRLAERLLDLALGPARGRAVLEVPDVSGDPLLLDAARAAGDAGVGSAIAVPLLVRDEVIGLLALYPREQRSAGEHETALLAALAGQLAVAVQNAQLHEQATRLGAEREAALDAERSAARQVRALYEVSRSFAQSLSLDETLKALARTVVDVLDVDAALVRMPDERREQLLPHALDVRDPQLAEAMRAILYRPQPFGSRAVQRVFRDARPHRVGREDTVAPTGSLQALAPFLEKGWTVADVPVALPNEVLASLTIASFDPGRPLSDETVDAAVAISAQAALAIDNARLYQQQKEFADTMQRSLLPRSRPDVGDLEVGEVYESASRVDVGGDVYDFLVLDDGRLAVVLGDVTGHGVEATADMAMAKFVFRSLAREHPEPGDFLAAANDVVCGEIAAGKFITMTYVVVDAERGEAACASAGHPPPRLLLPDGSVRGLDAKGLVLGIDTGQAYETVRAGLPPGAALVLYTDGVVEARTGRELYGVERLDALLERQSGLRARALAHAVTEDARAFSGGELADDLAVVVIRRAG